MLDPQHLDKFGDLVSTIGSRQFGMKFYSIFRDLLDVEECTVFSFPDPSNPQSLIVEGNCEEDLEIARRLAADYVSGGFLTDPNIQRANGNSPIDIYVVDADDFPNQEYRKHYYEAPSVSHELVVLGNAHGILYYTSFYRMRERHEFGPSEIATMRAIAGFMVKALHRHSELVRNAGEDGFNFVNSVADIPGHLRESTLEHLKQVLLSGPHKLSQREAEICASIVMGYSTEAISLNCSISVNTVATHRKRAYAKLRISSQNELFVRYFSTVRDFQASRII